MLSMNTVVDDMMKELAARRRTAILRQAGYEALVRAVLNPDETTRVIKPTFDRQPTPIGRAQRAA